MKRYNRPVRFTDWLANHDPRRIELRVTNTKGGQILTEIPVLDTDDCPRCARQGKRPNVLMKHGGDRQCVECQLVWATRPIAPRSVFEVRSERASGVFYKWHMGAAIAACNHAGIPMPEKHGWNNRMDLRLD